MKKVILFFVSLWSFVFVSFVSIYFSISCDESESNIIVSEKIEKKVEIEKQESKKELSIDETNLKSKVSNLIISVQYEYEIMNAQDYINSIYEASLKYNVPPEYIVAALATESSFRKNVVSKAGAIGPMQIIPKFWAGTENYDPNIFHDNIQLGSFILSEYKKQCGGTWECAFKAYNVGITNYKNKKLLKSQEIYWEDISKNLEKLKL